MKIVGFDIYKRFIRNNQFHFSFFWTELDIFLFFINETVQKQVHVIMHWDFQKDAPNELVCLHVFISNTAFSVSLQWRSPIQCLHNLNRNEYTRNLQIYENVSWKTGLHDAMNESFLPFYCHRLFMIIRRYIFIRHYSKNDYWRCSSNIFISSH